MQKQIEQTSYLTFKLGKETFASNVNKVLNILEMPNITEMPQTPEYIMGVMNLRGEVLPVIDSRIKFGMEATTVNTNTCVIVLEIDAENHTTKIGALVDSVEEVLEITEDNIKPAPTIGTKYNSDYILGLVQNNEGFIMILDMEKVFNNHKIISLQDHIEMAQ